MHITLLHMLTNANSTLYRFIHTMCTLGVVSMFSRSKNTSYSIKIQFLKNNIISHYCLVYHYQINFIKTDPLNMSWNVCITGSPKLWHVKGHNSAGDTSFICPGSAQHESDFSVESDVTRLAHVISLSSERELLSTNCWDAARTTHTNSLYEFCDIV